MPSIWNGRTFLRSLRSLRSDTVESKAYRQWFVFFLRSPCVLPAHPPSEHTPNANLKVLVLVQAFDFAKNERKGRKERNSLFLFLSG
jgi:hypothetical protein